MTKQRTKLPRGWSQKRLERVLTHYERQTPDQAAEEDDAAYRDRNQVFIAIPKKILPQVRKLIARADS